MKQLQVVVVVVVVAFASSCGILNGVTEGKLRSPLAGVFEGEVEAPPPAVFPADGTRTNVFSFDACPATVEGDGWQRSGVQRRVRYTGVTMMIRALSVVVVGVGLSACGILNGVTGGEFRSPLAGIFNDDELVPTGCDEDCEAEGLVCDDDSGDCEDCVVDEDCPDTDLCEDNECEALLVGCDGAASCEAPTPFCVDSFCRQCLSNGECDDPTPICNAEGFCEAPVIGPGCTFTTDCSAGQTCGTGGQCITEFVGCPATPNDAVSGNPLQIDGVNVGPGSTYFVPAGGIIATLVLLHDILGGNDRWNGAPLCDLVDAGYVVVNLQDTSVEATVAALEFLNGRYSTAHEHAALAAASSATEVPALLVDAVNDPEALPKRYILLSVGDYTGTPAALDSSLDARPVLFQTVAGDDQCGAASLIDCVSAQDTFKSTNSSWQFGVYPASGHGCDLLTNNFTAADQDTDGTPDGPSSQDRAQQFLLDTF
ncbi:MAG: hypothetical protein Q8O67_14955 [Deltaproteobacteria bacterium]|nr:hypothetical protein [Deltaproteobacteria bacterium]